MMLLSFEEYIDMKKFYAKEVSSNLTDELDKYLLEGGFPKTIFYDSADDKRAYIKSVIEEILEKDIKRRVKIRNVAVFEKVQTYLINNFGSTTSLKNMLSEGNKLFGYPTGGNTPDVNAKTHVLFQYGYNVGCLWNIFWIISDEDLKNRNFDKAVFSFDLD